MPEEFRKIFLKEMLEKFLKNIFKIPERTTRGISDKTLRKTSNGTSGGIPGGISDGTP